MKKLLCIKAQELIFAFFLISVKVFESQLRTLSHGLGDEPILGGANAQIKLSKRIETACSTKRTTCPYDQH